MSLLLHHDAIPLLSGAAFLALVTSVNDPDHRNRVQVRVLNADGVADQDARIWARVAVPFAGKISDAGDAVLNFHGRVHASMIGGQWAIAPGQ